MRGDILITGSSGLVGTALMGALLGRGDAVAGLDLRAAPDAGRGDVCKTDDVVQAVRGCRGIVHLAAVSRVVWGERDPVRCWSTNVDGTRHVLEAAASSTSRPWVLFASSREVYGEPRSLPVDEDAPLCPVNIYGRSKVAGEEAILGARDQGQRTAVVRLSNVYGRVTDHPDRVVPAFARAAAQGEPLRVEGADHTFDFTHIEDVVAGLLRLVALLDGSDPPPPAVHLVSERATTLGELAHLAVELAGTGAPILAGATRSYDVARFVGCGARARAVLDWRASVSLEEGLGHLIREFRQQPAAQHSVEVSAP